MDRIDLIRRAKAVYVAGARQAGKVLTRAGLLHDEAPPRDERIRHWMHSLTMVHDSLAMAELDVPWWTYRAIDFVEAWLDAHPRPIRVFEYGSGASTLWLARRTDEVHSVEHHVGFAEHMRPALAEYSNINFHVVEAVATTAPAIPSAKEGHAGLDFADYVATIDKVGGSFDVIVIDGRAREACLAAAGARLASGGIVVFDNSWRSRYRPAIAASGLNERKLRGLTPTLPYPDQTSVLSAG